MVAKLILLAYAGNFLSAMGAASTQSGQLLFACFNRNVEKFNGVAPPPTVH